MKWISLTGCRPLPYQVPDRGLVGRTDRVFARVPGGPHDPGPADHDIGDRVLVAGEDEGIEQPVAGAAIERRARIVDYDQVGARTRLLTF